MTQMENIEALTDSQFVALLMGSLGIGNIMAVEDAVTELERAGAIGLGINEDVDPRFVQLPLF